MDPSVQRLLTDKLYDKRKQGALEYRTHDSVCDVETDFLQGSSVLSEKPSPTKSMTRFERLSINYVMIMPMLFIYRTLEMEA